jgi:hypothetical protein
MLAVLSVLALSSSMIPEPLTKLEPTVQSIAEKINSSHDDCFQNLHSLFAGHCVNLNSSKRLELALSSMKCHLAADGRDSDFELLSRGTTEEVLRTLDGNLMNTYTTIFTGIDSLCFHLASEAQMAANFRSAEMIFQASSLATEFLVQSKGNLTNLTQSIVRKLTNVTQAMDVERQRISETHESIMSIIGHFQGLRKTIDAYRNSLRNLKCYGVGIVVAFGLSFFVHNVVITTIALTGLFLFAELAFARIINSHETTFAVAYIILCGAVQAIGIWRTVRPIGSFILGGRKQRPVRALPSLYATAKSRRW